MTTSAAAAAAAAAAASRRWRPWPPPPPPPSNSSPRDRETRASCAADRRRPPSASRSSKSTPVAPPTAPPPPPPPPTPPTPPPLQPPTPEPSRPRASASLPSATPVAPPTAKFAAASASSWRTTFDRIDHTPTYKTLHTPRFHWSECSRQKKSQQQKNKIKNFRNFTAPSALVRLVWRISGFFFFAFGCLVRRFCVGGQFFATSFFRRKRLRRTHTPALGARARTTAGGRNRDADWRATPAPTPVQPTPPRRRAAADEPPQKNKQKRNAKKRTRAENDAVRRRRRSLAKNKKNEQKIPKAAQKEKGAEPGDESYFEKKNGKQKRNVKRRNRARPTGGTPFLHTRSVLQDGRESFIVIGRVPSAHSEEKKTSEWRSILDSVLFRRCCPCRASEASRASRAMPRGKTISSRPSPTPSSERNRSTASRATKIRPPPKKK